MRLEYWKSMAKRRFETIEFLAAENRSLRRQLWGVTGVAAAAIMAVVCLSSALWSVYAS